MNHVTNDKGESVIAVGAPGSQAHCAVEYPYLIERLNALYADSVDCFGRSVDKAVELIRRAGIRSEMTTNSLLQCSLYGQEKQDSVTALTMSIAQSNKELFRKTYAEALRECVTDRPDIYAWPVSDVDRVASRMFDAMDKGTFHHEGPAFKLTSKRLGIKPTRTAILAFWKS